MFNIKIEKRHAREKSGLTSFSVDDIDLLSHCLIYVLEIYTGRYQDRTIFCEATDDLKKPPLVSLSDKTMN